MKVPVKSLDNKASGEIELSDSIFGLEPRADLLHRMVNWQQGNAGCQNNVLGSDQRLRDQQLGYRSVFPHLGDVLADPGLVDANLVRQAEEFQVPIVRIGEGSVRRMQGHHEHSEFHGFVLL